VTPLFYRTLQLPSFGCHPSKTSHVDTEVRSTLAQADSGGASVSPPYGNGPSPPPHHYLHPRPCRTAFASYMYHQISTSTAPPDDDLISELPLNILPNGIQTCHPAKQIQIPLRRRLASCPPAPQRRATDKHDFPTKSCRSSLPHTHVSCPISPNSTSK